MVTMGNPGWEVSGASRCGNASRAVSTTTRFPGRDPRKPRTGNSIRERLKWCLETAQLNTDITWHDLRHTFASHWMMDGGDIFKLSKILGHASVKQTMRYAHLAPTAFEEDYGRVAFVLPSVASVVSISEAHR